MKKILLSALAMAITLCATAQDTVEISMGAGYENEVYFKLSDLTENTFEAADWDVAFLRNSNFNLAARVNDGIDIKVYEVADTPAGYDTVDVTSQGGWIRLTNSDTNWQDGAFMQGSASFGFGDYNPATNTVEGKIVFVLEYVDGTFRKFFIEEYFGGYTFKHATWSGSAWSADTTATVSNTSNPDNIYNYYSLQDSQEVIAEPAAAAWDFVFRRYNTFINPPGENYVVSGVLHSPNVTVAQNQEATAAIDPNGLSYTDQINTIGYDWKNFGGSGFNVDSDQKYYVKYDTNTVYRLYFTEFAGSTSGDLAFVVRDVTDQLGIEDVTEQVSFGMFPNPTADGQVTIVYENIGDVSAKNTVEIYSMNGTRVYNGNVTNSNGFFTKAIDVSALQTGVYVVNFTSGDATITKKLIVE